MDGYSALGNLGWRADFRVFMRIHGQCDLGNHLGGGLATLAGSRYVPTSGPGAAWWPRESAVRYRARVLLDFRGCHAVTELDAGIVAGGSRRGPA